jgi:excisionase family DNA binding protein
VRRGKRGHAGLELADVHSSATASAVARPGRAGRAVTTAQADEQYLTPAQVAEELQVTVVTVRRWIANRELRATKAGPRLWTIRRSDLDRFLASGGLPEVDLEISDDPAFSKHLVAPDER